MTKRSSSVVAQFIARYAGKDYQVIGEPADVASAAELARTDPYQFQWWALSLIPAYPAGDDKRKGADKGIDGLKVVLASRQ